MEQQPTSPPKGTVDLFDALHSGAKNDPAFDPSRYLYTLGRDSRQGKYGVVMSDPQAILARYKDQPEYKGKPEALQADIATVQDLYTNHLPQSGELGRFYRPPQNYSEAMGIYPQVHTVEGHVDPYSHTDPSGTTTPWGGNQQNLATRYNLFYDRTGQLLKLTPKDLESRRFAVDQDMVTDADGNNLQRPILRELNAEGEGYGKELYSKWGSKPDTRTWLGALSTDFWNAMSGTSSLISSIYENSAGVASKDRLKTLYGAYALLGDSPSKASTVEDLVKRGVMYPTSQGGGADWFTGVQDEKLYDAISGFEKDQDHIRAQAKDGDPQAKLAVDMLDLYHGMSGKSALRRWMDTAHTLNGMTSVPTSYRRDQQGFFGGGEAIAGLLGQGVGFIGPQQLASRGLAELVSKVGSDAFVTRSVAQGMQKTLTKFGEKAVGWGSASIPTLQMAAINYQGARDAGASDEQAGDFALMSLPMVYATEGIISPQYLMRSYLEQGGSRSLRDLVASTLLKNKNLPSAAKPMKVFNTVLDWLHKSADGTLGHPLKNVLEGFAAEGAQGGLEQTGYDLVGKFLDSRYNNDLLERQQGGNTIWGDVWRNALAEGIMGGAMGGLAGGKRHVMPYDKTIASAVAGGKGQEVITVAQKLRQDGIIDDNDVQVIQQDVALSKDIMAGMDISDPQVLAHIQGQNDLVKDYAERSMQLKGMQERMDVLQEKLTSEPGNKDTIDRQIKVLADEMDQQRKAIQSILDGTEAVRRLKSAKIIVNDAEEDRGGLQVDAIDAIARQALEWIASEKDLHEKARAYRQEAMPLFNEALDNLIGAKDEKLNDALSSVARIVNELHENKAYSQEDAEKFRKVLKAKRAETLHELMNLDFEPKLDKSGGGEQAQNLAQLHQLIAEDSGLDAEEWLDNQHGPALKALQQGNEAADLYANHLAVREFENKHGANDAERDAFTATLPGEDQFKGPRDPVKHLEDFFSSIPNQDNTSRVPLADMLKSIKVMPSASQDQLDMIKGISHLVRAQNDAHRNFIGPLDQLASSFKGTATYKNMGTADEAKGPVGFNDLFRDQKEVYQPSKQMLPEVITKASDVADELMKEHTRLGGLLDQRRTQLDRFDVVNTTLLHKKIAMYAAFDEDLAKSEEFINTMATFESTQNPEQIPVLLARLQDMVSERMTDQPKRGIDFLRKTLDDYDWGTSKNASSYLETALFDRLKFEDWFKEGLYDDKDQSKGFKASGIVTDLTNWVSQMMRARVADVAVAYDAAIKSLPKGSAIPNVEQQQRIAEVVAFLNNPNQKLTADLASVVQSHRGILQKKGIERSITMLGQPGVGKTTMLPVIIKTLSGLKGRTQMRIAVMAPGTENSQKIMGSLNSMGHVVTVVSLKDVHKLATMPDLDLLIADEAHNLDSEDADRLRDAMKANGKVAGLFLGDALQSPSIEGRHETMPILGRMMRTIPLQTSFRAGNPEVLSAIDALRAQAFSNVENNKVVPELPIGYHESDGKGVTYLSSSPSDVYDRFADHLMSKSPMNAFLVVLDEKQRGEALASLDKHKDVIGAFTPEQLGRMVKVMDKGENSVLGLEAPMVYIAIGQEPLGVDLTRFLYTAASRAKQGIVMMLPGGRSELVKEIKQSVGGDLKNANDRLWRAGLRRSTLVINDLEPRRTKPEEKGEPNAAELHKQAIASLAARIATGATVFTPEELQLQENDGPAIEKELERIKDGSKAPAPPVAPELEPGIAGGQLFDEAPERVLAATRFSREHTPDDRMVVGLVATLPFNTQHPKGRQFTKENPVYKVRMDVLQGVSRNTNIYPVQLIKQSKGEYYNKQGGKYVGEALEIHLTDASMHVVNAALKKNGLSELSYEQALAGKYTMLGSLALNTLASRSSFANELATIKEQAFGKDSKWNDRESLPEYSDMRMGDLKQGQYDPQAIPVPYDTWKQHMEDKGFIVSDPYMDPGAWRDGEEGRPAIVTQVRPFAGGPPTYVFLRSSPTDQAYYTTMHDQLDRAQEKVDDGLPHDGALIEKLHAFGFIQWNRSLLYAKDGTPNIPGLEEIFKWSGKAPRFTAAREDAVQRIKDLHKALDLISADKGVGRKMTKAIRTSSAEATSKTGQQVLSIDPRDTQHTIAESDVHMPLLTVDFNSVPSLKKEATGNMPSSFKSVPRYALKNGSSQEKYRRKSITQVEEYYRRVFGNRFVDGKLEFRPRLFDMAGREVFGVMENGRIMLEENGGVKEGIDRHEAVHRVIDNLLDRPTRDAVLDAAKDEVVKRDGLRWGQVTDTMAHEYIAKRYEQQSYDTKSLVGRFVKWLKSALKRFRIYSNVIDDLLYDIENGSYKDSEALSPSDIPRYARKKFDDELDEMPASSIGANLAPERLADLRSMVPAPEVQPEDVKPRGVFRDPTLLSKTFGSAVTAHAVTRQVASELVRISQWQSPPVGGLTMPIQGLKAAKLKLFQKYAADADQVDTRVGTLGDDITDFRQLLPDDLHKLSDQEYAAYQAWKVGDPFVYGTILQTIFPGEDIEGELALDGSLDAIASEDPAEQRLAERDLANYVHESSDLKNPLDRMGALTRLMHDSTRGIDPPRKGEKFAVERDDARSINRGLLIRLGQRLAQFSSLKNDPVEHLGDALYDLWKKDPDSAEGHHAYTLYARYFAPDLTYINSNGTQVHSYRYLLKNAETIRAKYAGDAPSLQLLDNRIRMAERVVNNVVRSFIEMTTTDKGVTEYTSVDARQEPGIPGFQPQPGRLLHRSFRSDGVEDIKNDINQRVSAPFMPIGDNAWSIEPEYRQQWNTGTSGDVAGKALFVMDPRGVYFEDGQPLVKAVGEDFKLMTDAPELIEQFFRAARYPISAGTIQKYLSQDGWKTGPLPQIIGNWASAIHAGIHRIETGKTDEGLFSTRQVASINRRYGGVGSDTEEEKQSVPNPAMLFGLNRMLAETESGMRGNDSMGRVMNPDGDMVFSTNFGSAISTVFPSGTREAYSSKAAEGHVEEFVARDPGLRSGTRLLNPLIDSARPERITTREEDMGIRNTTLKFGRLVPGMTDLDVETVLFNNFARNVLARYKAERIVVPGRAFGNRGVVQLFRLDQPGGAGTNLFHVEQGNVVLNKAHLAKLAHEVFEYHKNLQDQSIARWNKFLGTSHTTAEEIETSLKSEAMLAKVRMDSTLMLNHDYVVDGKNVKTGLATNMAGSTIYTPENYQKWARAFFWKADPLKESPASALYSIYGPHIQAYKEALMELGFEHPSAVKRRTSDTGREALLDGYWILNHLVDHWTSTLLGGPSQNYASRDGNNVADGAKRSVTQTSPGQMAMVSDRGLGKTQQLAITEEIILPDGSKALDGQKYRMPWSILMARVSMGGPEGPMVYGANKGIQSQSDLIDKSMELTVTADVYRKNPWLQQKLKQALMPYPDLLQVWESGIGDAMHEPFAKAAQAVVDKAIELGVKDQLIGQITSESNIKMGLRAVNRDADTGPLQGIQIDTRFWRLQTKLDRPISGSNLRAPYFTQIAASMGVSPGNAPLMRELAQHEALISDLYLKQVDKDIASMEGEDRSAQVTNWMKSMAIDATRDGKETSQAAEMLRDPEASVNNPVLRRKVMEFIANSFSRDGINPKLNGQLFTQASSHGFTIIDAEGNHRELLSPREEGGEYRSGECMMPFMFAKQFGFKDQDIHMPINEMRTRIGTKLGAVGLNAFDRAMKVYVVRTPSAGPSSGHWLNVVGFVNDAGNVIFTPPGMNQQTGGDYDGDQLSVYLRRIRTNDHGLPFEEATPGTLEGSQSSILDIMERFYQDPSNLPFIMAKTGPDQLLKATDELIKEHPELYPVDPLASEPHTALSSMRVRRMAYDGDALIGILAQTMKGYSFLSQAYHGIEDEIKRNEIFKGWQPPLNGGPGELVLGNISQLMNGALDSLKLMDRFGLLGLRPSTINVVSGAVLSGVPLKEALALAKHPTIVDAAAKFDRQETFNKVEMPAKKKTLMQLVRSAGTPMLDIETQHPVPNSLLLQYIALAEQVNRATKVFSLNVNGVPADDGELATYQYNTEQSLNATWDQVLTDKPSAPDHYLTNAPFQGDTAGMNAFRKDEELIRSFFDIKGVVGHLPSVKAWLGVANKAVGLYGEGMLHRSPVMQAVQQEAIHTGAFNGVFKQGQHDRYLERMNMFLYGIHLDQQFSGQPIIMGPDNWRVDIGHPGGQDTFVRTFPDHWRMLVDKVRSLPETDQRRISYQNSVLLSNVRITGGKVPRVEIIDNRKFADPDMAAQVRRDFEKLESIFSGDIMPKDSMPMHRMLSLYDTLLNHFGYARNSFTRYLPSSETALFGRFLDRLEQNLREQGAANSHYANSHTGQVRSFEDLAYGVFIPALYVSDDLFTNPVSSKKVASYQAQYFKAKRPDGSFSVRETAEPNTVLVNPHSELGVRIASSGGNILENGHAFRMLDNATWHKFLSGEKSVVVTFDKAPGFQEGKPVTLPDGQRVNVTSVMDEGKSITFDASGIVPPSDGSLMSMDDHQPGVMRTINHPSHAEYNTFHYARGYHGAYNSMMDGLSLGDALKRVSIMSLQPEYRKLAGFLLEQQEKLPRDSRVSVVDFDRPGLNGMIHPDGNIELSRTKSALDTDATLLHEGVHRFTRHMIDLPDEQLTPEERRFKQDANALYQQVKDKAGDSRLRGLKDVNEFIAEGMSNPDFQDFLRTINANDGKNFFWKLINWIRGLFRNTVTNDYVNAVVDMTTKAIRYQTEEGRSFNSEKYADILASLHSEDDTSVHGVLSEFGPITDIKDIQERLLSKHGTGLNYKELTIDKKVNLLFSNNIDMTRTQQWIAGKSFDIGHLDEEGVREYLRKEIVPFIADYEQERKVKIMDILNHQPDIKGAWVKNFVTKDGKRLDTDEVRDTFLRHIDHEDGAIYLKYSDLSDPERIIKGDMRVKDLGIVHVPDFAGHDPIVQVKKNSMGTSISLIDTMSGRLGQGSLIGAGKHLFSNYMPGFFQSYLKNIRTPATEGGARKALLTMTAMAMHQANPDLKFRRIKVFGFNATGVEHDAVWINETLQELKLIKQMPPLYNALTPGMKAVLDDESLYESTDYNQSILPLLHDLLRTRPVDSTPESLLRDNLINALDGYDQSEEGQDKILLEALKNIQRIMVRDWTPEAIRTDKEYQYVSQAIVDLVGRGTKGANSIKDTSKVGLYGKNAMDVNSDLLQLQRSVSLDSVGKIVAVVTGFRKKLHQSIAELDKNSLITNKLVNNGSERFKHLFQYSAADEKDSAIKVRDRNGKLVPKVKLNILHWDKSDPHTAAMLRNGDLTTNDLKVANDFLDMVHDSMVDGIMHNWYQDGLYRNENGHWKQEQAKAEAKQYVDRHYPRGWVPVVQRHGTEAVYEKKFFEALGDLQLVGKNADNIFGEDMMGDKIGQVTNRYLAEMENKAPVSAIGGYERLGRMGLSLDDLGNIILDKSELNERATANMEIILTNQKVATQRMLFHEGDTVPVIHAIRSLLAAQEAESSKPQPNNLAWSKMYANRIIFRNAPDPLIDDTSWRIKPSVAANTLMSVTSWAGVAFSWKVAVASGAYNFIAFHAQATANGLANNGLYGMKEAAETQKLILSDKERAKIFALVSTYQIYDAQEGDLTGNQKFSKTYKPIFSSHGMNVMNRVGDNGTRALVMVAQMLKEGTWDAHYIGKDGELHYDQTKDKRLYEGGRMTAEGAAHIKTIRRMLLSDGIWDQKEGEQLKMAYSLKMARAMKALSDKYVIGGMDRSEQIMADSFWLGRLFTQFKKYLPAKIYNWNGRIMNSDALGRLRIVEGKDGPESVWEKREITNYMHAWTNAVGKVGDAYRMGWKESRELSEADRTGLYRSAIDLSIMMMLYALYAGFKPDKDDKKKTRFQSTDGLYHGFVQDRRVLSLFNQAAQDMFSGSMPGLVYTFGANRSILPAVNTAYRMGNIMLGDPKQAWRFVPGNATMQAGYDMYESASGEEPARKSHHKSIN